MHQSVCFWNGTCCACSRILYDKDVIGSGVDLDKLQVGAVTACLYECLNSKFPHIGRVMRSRCVSSLTSVPCRSHVDTMPRRRLLTEILTDKQHGIPLAQTMTVVRRSRLCRIFPEDSGCSSHFICLLHGICIACANPEKYPRPLVVTQNASWLSCPGAQSYSSRRRPPKPSACTHCCSWSARVHTARHTDWAS